MNFGPRIHLFIRGVRSARQVVFTLGIHNNKNATVAFVKRTTFAAFAESDAQTFSDAPVAQHLQVLLGPNARDLSRIGAICQAVPRTSPPKCVISPLKKRPHTLCR